MSKIETLWETYDFILNKIVSLEDEISYLIDQDITGQDKTFIKKVSELINAYNKQLFTIKEIKTFCNEHPTDVSEERQVALDTLEELEQVTLELKEAMSQNIKKKFDN